MSEYLREKFKRLDPYTPGEQPKDQKYIKLNTNESPFPPGPKVLEAVSKDVLANLRLYPSPDQFELKEGLAGALGNPELKRENIFVSNGSDDIINFAFMAFAGENTPAVFPDISYGFYSVFADFQNVKSVVIPLTDDFRIDVSDYQVEVYQGILADEYSTPGLVVFANPNAPTGIALSLEEIGDILEQNQKSVVLVDEAYVDFGADSAVSLIPEYDNLLVARTYSKSASLAGARLGYAIGNAALIQDLELMKFSTNPYNINRMTEAAGLAVLRESDYYLDNCNRIITTRKWVREKLIGMGFFVPESKANFLFVGAGEYASEASIWSRITGEEIYKNLKENGILVRWFNKERIKNFVRITIGTDEDMNELISVLERKGNEWLR